MKKVLKVVMSLCIGISLNGFSQEVSFFNGDGFFSVGTQSNRTASITLFDIDKDGDLDALVANGRHWAEQNYIYYNDGKGNFKSAQPIGKFMDASYAVKSADFNDDGFMDIAVANDNIENKLYFGSANNQFKEVKAFASIAPSRNLEVADIDNDGDVDLILSNRKAKNEICLNNGKGVFDTLITFGDQSEQTLQTIVVDINADGFLDLITAERGGKNKIYLNDGKLNFAVVEFGDEKDDTRSIDIGDFDKDGFPDILAGNLGSENIIYFGNKQLTFEKTHTFKESRMTLTPEQLDQLKHEINLILGL